MSRTIKIILVLCSLSSSYISGSYPRYKKAYTYYTLSAQPITGCELLLLLLLLFAAVCDKPETFVSFSDFISLYYEHSLSGYRSIISYICICVYLPCMYVYKCLLCFFFPEREQQTQVLVNWNAFVCVVFEWIFLICILPFNIYTDTHIFNRTCAPLFHSLSFYCIKLAVLAVCIILFDSEAPFQRQTFNNKYYSVLCVARYIQNTPKKNSVCCQMKFSILGFSCATATGTLRSRSTSF